MKTIPGRTPISWPHRGFTLIELLVVITIVAVLAGLAMPVMATIRRKGAMTRELNAGRQLILAYQSCAVANDGVLLKGYDKTAGDVQIPQGPTISGVMSERYPWRLAAYVGGQINDLFLINDTRRTTDALATDSFQYQYLASLYPSFGINAYCVGGYDDGSGNGYFTTDCVTRVAAAARPSSLIVFASARYRESTSKPETPGFHLVTPPKLWRSKWTVPFDRKKTPSSYGNVDPRWDGKALCAFLDGHVALLGEAELTDMRHWSNQAAETDNPNFAVPR